jgi:hypothetical protein
LRAPKWYLALTAHLLPERLRGEFGLVFGERGQRSMNLALALIRRLYPRLPMGIRAVGPYQEAWRACKARDSPAWQCVGSIDFGSVACAIWQRSVSRRRSSNRVCIIHVGKQSADATQYQPSDRGKWRSLGISPPQHIDLLLKHHNLCLKRSTRPEKVDKDPKDQSAQF